MKKIIAAMLSVVILFTSLSCFAFAYASNAVTMAIRECSQVTISGIDNNISKDVKEDIVDTIAISQADHVSVALQSYDEDSAEWITRKKFIPSSNTLQITYPNYWKTKFITKWRLYIPSNEYHTSYTSEEITIASQNIVNFKLYSKAVCLVDAETGLSLYDKNGQKEMPMASTTKIMTALLAFENCKLDDKVNISYDAAMAEYGCLMMYRNDKYYVKDLLYGLMLQSSNDAAVALATHMQPSVKAFATMMNNRANQLGLKHTNFVTPNGLHDPNHYSTAYDMSIIHGELAKYDDYLIICRTPKYTVKDTKGKHKVKVTNTDKIIDKHDNMLGGKTGFTTPAGYCFTCIYQYKGRIYTFTTLGSKTGWGRWSDCEKIIKYIEKYA